jgi:hypothetical protein
MSTIRRTKKGEVKAWCTACEDVNNLTYSRDDARSVCYVCGLDCGVKSKEPIRCLVRFPEKGRARK